MFEYSVCLFLKKKAPKSLKSFLFLELLIYFLYKEKSLPKEIKVFILLKREKRFFLFLKIVERSRPNQNVVKINVKTIFKWYRRKSTPFDVCLFVFVFILLYKSIIKAPPFLPNQLFSETEVCYESFYKYYKSNRSR